VKAWQRLKQFSGEASVSVSWMSRIVITSADQLRKQTIAGGVD